VTAAQLKIGPDVASTQMACPAQVMDLGGSFMDALMLVRGYRIQGAELQLLDAAGAEVAAFSALSHSLTGVMRDRP
jgi:heat shock protein HslJ